MGLRSMAEGFRHLRGETPAVGHVLDRPQRHDLRHAPGRVPGTGRPPLRRAVPAWSASSTPRPGPARWSARCSPGGRPGSATRAGPSPPAWSIWGGDHRRLRRRPRPVDRPRPPGHGRCGRRHLGRVPPERAAAGGPRPPPGSAVGHVLRRGGRRPAPRRRRDRRGRGHRRSRVRGVVGRSGLRRRGRGPAVAGARAVAGRRRGPAAVGARPSRRPWPRPSPSWARASRSEPGRPVRPDRRRWPERRRPGGGPGHQLLADLPQPGGGRLRPGPWPTGVFSRHLAKYLPVTPSTSGDEHR